MENIKFGGALSDRLRSESEIEANQSRFVLVVGIVLLMLLGTTNAASQTTGSKPTDPDLEKKKRVEIEARCNVGNQLLQVDLVNEASNAFEVILKDSDLLKGGLDLGCASIGMKDAKKAQQEHGVKVRCQRASDILKAGLPSEASKAYKNMLDDADLLKGGLDLGCASSGMKEASDAELKDTLKKALTLSRLGFDDDAKSAIKTTLDTRPDLALPKDLKHLESNRTPLWYVELQRIVIDQVLPVLEVLALGGIPLFFVMRRWIWGRPVVDTISGAEADKSSLSGEFCRTLENALLNRDSSLQGSFLLVRESPTVTPPDIKNVAGSSWISKLPWLDTLANFIVWLIYRPPIELSGNQIFDAKRGRGVTLQLHYRKRILAASEALWELDFGLPITKSGEAAKLSAEPLADLGAIWVAAILANHSFTLRQFIRRHRRRTKTIWRADALIHAGLRAYQNNEFDTAKALFVHAHQVEPENTAALVNLGRSLYASDKVEQEDRQRALDLLEEANSVTRATNDPRILRIRYAALFNLAALNIDRAEFDKAETWAQMLVNEVEAKLMKDGIGDAKQFRIYLESNLPATKCLLAGCVAARGGATAQQHLKDLEVLGKSMGYLDRYNLACTYSLFAMNAGSGSEEQSTYSSNALYHLKEALWLAQYAKISTDRNALARRLAQRAREHDGAFKWLREQSPFGDKFKAIVDEGNFPPPAQQKEGGQ
jgi:hypothetical protein